MFQTLSDRLGAVFHKLRSRGVLSAGDINDACREIRIALLEADVALPVVKDFIEEIKNKAHGQEVVKSITPGQLVVKIVHDELVALLSSTDPDLNLAARPPVVLLMVGLQGAGKTTASAKLALHLREKRKKKVLMASLDVYRPAAQEQLAVLGRQINVDTLPIIEKEKPLEITRRALDMAKLQGYDLLILDTAGRLHLDQALMEEVRLVKEASSPTETLLVVDAMTGQDAVMTGKAFQDQIGLTGVMMTRLDGDTRGGAALSMRAVTGCPIKFAGVGEKVHQLEPFYPERVAGRILGMGDVVSLVEKAIENADAEEDARLERRMQKGIFDLNDLEAQLKKMQKMGGLASLMSMLPGMGKIQGKLDEAGFSDRALIHQVALIQSMTPQERKYPKLLNASRKRRVALGAGCDVAALNRLLKQFEGMGKMMKKMQKMGKKGLMRGGLSNLFGGPPR